MKRGICLFLFACVLGCGGSQPGVPAAKNGPDSDNSSPAAAATGMPSTNEAIDSIRDFFTDSGIGLSNVEVENVSAPVEAPNESVQGSSKVWACSVTLKCDNVIGEKQLNKNWLVLIGREQGKARVASYYKSLTEISESKLGKEWFAKSGFAEPSIE